MIRMLLIVVTLGFYPRMVWVCESDGQIVKPRDIYQHRHVSERDDKGNIVTLCGWVHRARIGSGTAVGLVGDVK